jgi:UDP-glucuronate 4-epimerase
VGLDNFDPYYPREHKERNLVDLREQPRFALRELDLRDAAGVREAVAADRPDAVAHLAAMCAVRYSVQHPLVYGEVNVQGSLNLLDAVRLAGVRRIVLASSSSVYGADTPVPFREDAAADHPLAPYPASKRAMEHFGHCYHHLWGLNVTVLRFFNVYGPHGRPEMMPWVWSRAIAAGEPLTVYAGGRLQRDWTYIEDIVGGVIASLDRGLEWAVLNLGAGRPVENLRFVGLLEELVGKKAVLRDVPAPPSEPPVTYADVSRAAELLNYRPTTPVEEGLARFVAWLRSFGLI